MKFITSIFFPILIVFRLFKSLAVRYGRKYGSHAALVLLCLIMWALTPYFMTTQNLLIVIEQSSINAIIAVGMTYVILTAGIDLSVGSILALSGVVLASALHAGWSIPMTILVGLATGTACGLINGLLITLGRLAPFIATLGMMSAARGATLVYCGGRPISGFTPGFRNLAESKLLWIPIPILVMAVIYLIAHFVLSRTRFGRNTYAIGGNERATILSGVNVRFYKTCIYAISGFTSGVAAVLLTARLESATPTAGTMYELDAIAATVIGGTSLMGGEGRMSGTLTGALIIGVLRNGLNLLGVSSYLQQIVIGGVIVLAAIVDAFLKAQKK